MPFKRYQIQPVWRADRPQKGRYREFYQCDADVVGSDSLLNEVELMQIVDTVFTKFGVRVCIKINNRKILTGIAEVIGEAEKIVDITVAIDKLDKIGLDNVNEELRNDGISEEAIEKLQPIISLSGTNDEKLEVIAKVLEGSEVGLKGVEETKFILDTLMTLGLNNEIELDLTLARGLNYYTGAIFEVKALDTPMGSITGGGRYDNLTGIFGLPGLSGFAAEMTIFFGSFQEAGLLQRVFTVAACASIVITAVYILRVVGKLLFGEVQNEHHRELTDAVWYERFSTTVLICSVAAIGCFPNFFGDIIRDSFLPVVDAIKNVL